MRSSACVAGARSRVHGRFGLAFLSSIATTSIAAAVAAAAFVALSFAASPAAAASITGTVRGPDGAPVRAAFVQARHGKLKMTVSVLTDAAGRYAVENLPAGEYRLSVRLIGAKAEPKNGIALAADATASRDFALQAAPVRWSDLTTSRPGARPRAATGGPACRPGRRWCGRAPRVTACTSYARVKPRCWATDGASARSAPATGSARSRSSTG